MGQKYWLGVPNVAFMHYVGVRILFYLQGYSLGRPFSILLIGLKLGYMFLLCTRGPLRLQT